MANNLRFPRNKTNNQILRQPKPNKNLAEDGQLVQYSVYMTHDQRAAKATRDLVKHYDGQVMMFRGELIEL